MHIQAARDSGSGSESVVPASASDPFAVDQDAVTRIDPAGFGIERALGTDPKDVRGAFPFRRAGKDADLILPKALAIVPPLKPAVEGAALNIRVPPDQRAFCLCALCFHHVWGWVFHC